MSHVEQDSYANNADCQLFCDGIITATPNAAVLGILVYLNKSWKTTRYAFFARPFPFSFVDFAFSWSMKSLIMSCKASFLLVTSNTSSVVMVERPACREKLSRSIVTFSTTDRIKKGWLDRSRRVETDTTYLSDAIPSQSMLLWIGSSHWN